MKQSGIAVYLNDEQKKKIKQEADKLGLSISAYFRSLGLSKIVKGEIKNE